MTAIWPATVSRKKLRQWNKLPEAERKMFQVDPGRHPMPDAQNDVGLPSRL